MSELEQVVAGVTSSKKYRTVCADTVRRIAEREVANQGNEKAAIKATKRRLHQVYGAFEQAVDYDALYRQMEVAYRSGSEDRIRAACRQILDLHSSTRERLPILERFYPAIFEATGRPGSILDLGCGLNPVALPWMGLSAGARYIALDIDRELDIHVEVLLELFFEELAGVLERRRRNRRGVADTFELLSDRHNQGLGNDTNLGKQPAG